MGYIKKNRKIAYCIPSLALQGGMERVLTVKANYLADIVGYDVYIIVTDDKDKQPFYALSEKVNLINLEVGFGELWKYSFFKRVFVYLRKQQLYKARLTKALKKIRPDITDTLMRREINFINSINDGSIKIGEIHNNRHNYRNFEEGNTNFLKQIFANFWMKSLISKIRKLRCFVVLSSEDKNNWTELSNVHVINNPISIQSDITTNLEAKNVIAVGRYTYQKGFDLLLQAWIKVQSRHSDWNLYIYGAGDKTAFIKQCNTLGINNSCHLESATSDIISKYLNSSVFVLSSRFEGFPMVLPEAMSVGLPCVAFTCPCGTKDIIKDGEDGLWVKNGDINMLADKICYLIEHPIFRKNIGQNAYRNIQRLCLKNIMKQWIDLFDKLMDNKYH